MFGELLALVGLGAAVVFVADSLKARERMLARIAIACKELNVQLLDETVAVARLGLGRNKHGHVRIKRLYRFEFSADGAARAAGTAEMLGQDFEYVHLDLPDGPTLLQGTAEIVPFPPPRRDH